MKNYKEGDIIKCMVTAIENYGFFVSTEFWFSGLVHISEITSGYVKDIFSYVNLGDVIYCQIIEVDEVNSHLKLSIKNINYKSASNSKKNKINENQFGFISLKKALPKWIEEKLEEIN